MSLSWKNLSGKIHPWIEEAVSSLGFSYMTPVQAASIPLFCTNKDVVVESVTGSGKTISFVIPVLHHVSNILHGEMSGGNGPELVKRGHMLAVIITPTRELASQIQAVFDDFLPFVPENLTKIRTQLVVGSLGSVRQDLECLLKQRSHIIIATPGRFTDLLKSNKVYTNSVEIAVLDEADKLLDMSFEGEVLSILKQLPHQRRTGLYSATLSAAGDRVFRTGMSNPVRINVQTKSITKSAVPKSLTIQYAFLAAEHKLSGLMAIIQDYRFKKCIVYLPTCTGVRHFNDFLRSLKLPHEFHALHGQLTTPVRLRSLQRFTDADTEKKQILFTTDVAARGIDIPDVDLVVQMDPPSDPDMFLHRCGRTGRANKVGRALVFLNKDSPEEGFVDFMNVKKVYMEEFSVPHVADSHQLLQQQLESYMRADRARHELAVKAYVGFVRHYQKHVATSIFRLQSLDYLGTARLYGLLRLPKMPETEYIPNDQMPENGWLVEAFDMDKYAYADSKREKQRVDTLEEVRAKMIADAKKRKALKIKNQAWSEKKQTKHDRDERREKNKRKREAIEKKLNENPSDSEEEQVDWKDVVRSNKKAHTQVTGSFEGL